MGDAVRCLLVFSCFPDASHLHPYCSHWVSAFLSAGRASLSLPLTPRRVEQRRSAIVGSERS